MIDLSNVIALALGSDDVLQIQDAIGTVLWQKIIYYNVNISAGSNGTVSVNGVSGNYSQSVPSGTVLTIEGIGDTGYDFDEWSDGNTTNPRTITVTGDLTLTASFESAVTYYNVSISTSTGGTVSVNGVSGNYSQSVPSGTVLTIEGTGNTGYNFDEWSDGNTTNPRTVTVNSDITLTATFEADLINTYFYIENPNDSSVTLTITKNINSAPTVNVSYSEDQIHWLSMGDTSTTGITHNVNAHRKLYLKATTSAWGTSSDNNRITVNGNFNVGGNIMSLLYGDNFQNQTSVNSYAFKVLFGGDTNLLSAGDLKIPATIVHEGSYYQLFTGCSALTTAPTEISATTLATKCYLGMFSGCSSLTTAPTLPATTLATFCYSTMFKDCTSLTTAPVLPATTLLQSSYASLFNGCSSLNSVTSYAQDISASQCTNNWLNGVAATGDFYNMGGATYTSGDPSGIPTGWTEHKLYNVTISTGNNGSVSVNGVIGNYSQRVQGGTVLTIEGLPNSGYLFSTWSDSNTTNPRTITVTGDLTLTALFESVAAPNYFYIENTSNDNVDVEIIPNGSSSPSFTVWGSLNGIGGWMSLGSTGSGIDYMDLEPNQKLYLRATTNKWATGTSDYITINVLDTLIGDNIEFNVGGNIMSLLYGENFENTTLTYSNSYAFCNLFNGSKVEDASDLDLPSNTMPNCYNGMFKNDTSLIAAPVLPATTVAGITPYKEMFYGCSSLEEIVTYNTNYSSGAFNNWLYDVAPSGDFYNLGGASFTLNDPSGIPTGWTEHNSL